MKENCEIYSPVMAKPLAKVPEELIIAILERT